MQMYERLMIPSICHMQVLLFFKFLLFFNIHAGRKSKIRDETRKLQFSFRFQYVKELFRHSRPDRESLFATPSPVGGKGSIVCHILETTSSARRPKTKFRPLGRSRGRNEKKSYVNVISILYSDSSSGTIGLLAFQNPDFPLQDIENHFSGRTGELFSKHLL